MIFINTSTEDEYIENLKNGYSYYSLKAKMEEEIISYYKNDDTIDRLKYMGITDIKYATDDYIKKISVLNYPELIYQNFQLETKGRFRNCTILHLPIFNLNGISDVSPLKTPIIILDFYLIITLRLICYSFMTYLFVVNNKFVFDSEFVTKNDVFKEIIVPSGFSFIKYYVRSSPDDLLAGFKSVHIFSKENWRIWNNSSLLCNAIILFIICHEQAHHELGHVKLSDDKNDETTNSNKINHKMELAADQLALSMFMECNNTESEFGLFNFLETFYLAPFIFFEMLHSIEWLTNSNDDNCSHPRAKKRYMNILHNFSYTKYNKDVPLEEIEQWNNYFQALINIARSSQ